MAGAVLSPPNPKDSRFGQLFTPRPGMALGTSKRVSLQAPDDFTPRRFVRLRFDDEGDESSPPPSKAPPTPFDCVVEECHEESWRWPTTPEPESGGSACVRQLTDDPVFSSSSSSSNSSAKQRMALTPDPSAFGSDGLRRKTPRQKHPLVCPPTPVAPVPMSRQSSLWESKILDSLRTEEAGLVQAFHRDFSEIVPVGCGSFFDVYRARSRIDGCIYALKRSRKTFRGRSDRESYLREARMLHLLGSSKHVVSYRRAWQEDGHFIVQMEYCESNLSDLLANLQGPHFDEAFVWDCLFQIASGLQHVHANQLLHLDMKPDNVLVSRDGTLKIGDFGQAVTAGSWEDGREGDCRYVSPELVDTPQGYMLGPACDIFSTGLLAFELLTQVELPTAGDDWHRLRDGDSPRKHLEHVESRELVDLVMRMLDPSPRARPTADDVVHLAAGQNRAYTYPDVHALLKAVSPASSPQRRRCRRAPSTAAAAAAAPRVA